MFLNDAGGLSSNVYICIILHDTNQNRKCLDSRKKVFTFKFGFLMLIDL